VFSNKEMRNIHGPGSQEENGKHLSRLNA
jgi:hypothetical protein